MAEKKDSKKKKKVLFVGDTHVEFAFMNYALKELKPDVAIAHVCSRAAKMRRNFKK